MVRASLNKLIKRGKEAKIISYPLPVADPGFLELICCARERIFRSHAHFRAKTRPLSRQTTSSTSPIDLFSNEFQLKHSMVSHSSSFLSSVARRGGGSIYLTSVYFLVLGVAKSTPGSATVYGATDLIII